MLWHVEVTFNQLLNLLERYYVWNVYWTVHHYNSSKHVEQILSVINITSDIKLVSNSSSTMSIYIYVCWVCLVMKSYKLLISCCIYKVMYVRLLKLIIKFSASSWLILINKCLFFRLSVSACIRSALTGRIFMKFDIADKNLWRKWNSITIGRKYQAFCTKIYNYV